MNTSTALKTSRVRKAVAYARFSSDNQRDESIDAQLRAIYDFASRNDIIVINEYIDKAFSAKTDNRPSFLQMIKDSIKGEYDLVLVHKLDRFARNRYDSAHYNHQLKKNNVKLVSVIENFDDSPEGIMMMALLEGMSEYYSANLSREVKKGMQENALKAMHTGGIAPLGYDIDPQTRKLIINEHEAQAVKLIFKMAVQGYSYDTIAEELRKLSYKTKVGREFARNSLNSILANEKYTGTYIFNRSSAADMDGHRNSHKFKDDEDIIRIENAIPALVSKADFDTIAAMMQKRKHQFLGHNCKEVYLLSGKIFCGLCGTPFTGYRRYEGRNKTLVVRYTCTTRNKKGKSGCACRDIRREKIEALVLDELSKNIFDERLLPLICKYWDSYKSKADAPFAAALAQKQKEMVKYQKEISSVIALLKQTSSKALLIELEGLENKAEECEREYNALKNSRRTDEVSMEKLSRIFNQAREMFREGKLQNMKQLIDTFVERVIIHDDKIELEFRFSKNNPPSPNGGADYSKVLAFQNTNRCGGLHAPKSEPTTSPDKALFTCSKLIVLAPSRKLYVGTTLSSYK